MSTEPNFATIYIRAEESEPEGGFNVGMDPNIIAPSNFGLDAFVRDFGLDKEYELAEQLPLARPRKSHPTK